MREFNMLLPF